MNETRSLLVVDDVPEILQFFTQIASTYKTHALEVVTLNDPRAALRLVATRGFDVIISDFNMPNVDGLQVLTEAFAHYPHGRRILMTGYNEVPATAEMIAAANLSARIGKPVSVSYLRRFLQACFSDEAGALDEYQETTAA